MKSIQKCISKRYISKWMLSKRYNKSKMVSWAEIGSIKFKLKKTTKKSRTSIFVFSWGFYFELDWSNLWDGKKESKHSIQLSINSIEKRNERFNDDEIKSSEPICQNTMFILIRVYDWVNYYRIYLLLTLMTFIAIKSNEWVIWNDHNLLIWLYTHH